MINLKDGDIYHWSWNDEEYSKRELEIQSGTLYWCCSRIGIVKDGVLRDTYWHSGSEGKQFTSKDCAQKLDLSFIANFADLVSAQPSDRAMYLDEDCVNLNHPNSTSGNFYLRKGAEKNLDKMKRVKQRELRSLKSKIEQLQWELKVAEDAIKNIKVEDRLYLNRNVCLTDNSWEDDLND